MEAKPSDGRMGGGERAEASGRFIILWPLIIMAPRSVEEKITMCDD